jgi:translocation and assembly module TamA
MKWLQGFVLLFTLLSFSSFAEVAPTSATNPEPIKNDSQLNTQPPAKLEVAVELDKGADSDLTKQLVQELPLSYLKNDAFPAQTDFLYQRAESELLNVLKALGYYSPKITSQLTRQPNLTRVTFKIDLGDPVRIRKIDLEIIGDGKNLSAWRQFQKFQLTLKPKAIFTHQDYTDTVSALTNIAVNEGYMDYEFTQREFKVYPHLKAVDIYLHLNTHAPYRFGKVTFQGSKQINDAFLHRYVEFTPGDIYRQEGILTLQKGLIDSNYFGLIRVAPQYSNQQDRHIPIHVELEDSLKHRFEMGGGYGTDTGARVLFGFENRLVNQQGHNYQIDSLFGENAQNLSFNYRIPGKHPATQHWNMGLKFDATQSDTLNRSLKALSAGYSYQINPEWLIHPFISFESEDFRYTKDPSNTTQTLLFGSSVKNRWVNNETYPTAGYQHNATLRVSIDNIVSDSQFAQLELSTRKVFSLAEFWRLHLRAKTMLTLADKNQSIPASYLTLLGGENLRGYKFESIGIESDTNSIIGARNSLSGSVETDYRLTQYFGLGLFVDAGQLFDHRQTGDIKVGAGFGLRGYTPVGMAKLDIAWPVSEKAQPWRIHFSLGFDL